MQEITIKGVEIQYDKSNIKIINSYKIKKEKDMEDILFWFMFKTGYKSKRNILSWIKEWKAHNRLYKLGLYRSHTVDCDFAENEKWCRLLVYSIIGI